MVVFFSFSPYIGRLSGLSECNLCYVISSVHLKKIVQNKQFYTDSQIEI